MKLICPALGREEVATDSGIVEVVSILPKREDPFVILEKTEMNYMQVLWTPEGFHIEYQEDDIFHHFQVKTPISQEAAVWAMQSYLAGQVVWKDQFEFEKKEIATPSYKAGHKLGSILGRIARFFSVT